LFINPTYGTIFPPESSIDDSNRNIGIVENGNRICRVMIIFEIFTKDSPRSLVLGLNTSGSVSYIITMIADENIALNIDNPRTFKSARNDVLRILM